MRYTTPPMSNVKLLQQDLIRKNWTITAFPFKYKSITYIVLFELLDKSIKNNRYYIAQITFIHGKVKLSCKANRYELDLCISTFRKFFNIEYTENVGDLLNQFYRRFGASIPPCMPSQLTNTEKAEVISKLSEKEGDPENSIYCYDARHNGKFNDKQHYRTSVNDDKTKLLRPSLYSLLAQDKTISFFYSPNPDDECSDDEILAKLANRHQQF